MYSNGQKIVLTLDAGGTNFVFSAMGDNGSLLRPVSTPSYAMDLNKCLDTIVEGFTKMREQLQDKPVAISFAFPGPADYRRGIIGDLPNFPSFRGGVALGPMLEEIFDIPVFINNDGWLYAYGEAMDGSLPWINHKLEKAGSFRQYRNLIGITLGTGFGCGFVCDGKLITGDNIGAEAWTISSRHNPVCNIEEEGVSTRAVQRLYHQIIGVNDKLLSPKEICEIATGQRLGNQQAALAAYSHLGKVLGDGIANIIALFDGVVVIGGGLAGAKNLIIPALMEEITRNWETYTGNSFARLSQSVYCLNEENQLQVFLNDDMIHIPVFNTKKTVKYQKTPKTGIVFSANNTSEMISKGAYMFAVNELETIIKL